MTTKPIVIVTGWRRWPHPVIIWARLDAHFHQLGPFTLFHGHCTDKDTGELVGADGYADQWGTAQRGVDVRPFPANWDAWGHQAGRIRNKHMIDMACSLAPRDRIHGLAFPGPDPRGTKNCMRYMREARIAYETWDIPRTREWLEATA